MGPASYESLSELQIFALGVWRESDDQSWYAWTCVGHVIKRRTEMPSWWNGHVAGSYHAVILQPKQFSSFNQSDPNNNRWPDDHNPQWQQIVAICTEIMNGTSADPTNGATHYFSPPLNFEEACHLWGDARLTLEETARSGSMHFCKLMPRQLVDIRDCTTLAN